MVVLCPFLEFGKPSEELVHFFSQSARSLHDHDVYYKFGSNQKKNLYQHISQRRRRLFRENWYIKIGRPARRTHVERRHITRHRRHVVFGGGQLSEIIKFIDCPGRPAGCCFRLRSFYLFYGRSVVFDYFDVFRTKYGQGTLLGETFTLGVTGA